MVFADMVSAVLGWDSRSLLPLAPPTPSPVPLHCRERPSGEERPFLCPLGLCPSTLTHWKPHFSFLCWIRRAWISLVSVQWKFWFHCEPRRKQINMKPKDETVLAFLSWEAEWLLYPIQELNHVKSKIVSLLMEALRARSFPLAPHPFPHGQALPPSSTPPPPQPLLSSFFQHKSGSFKDSHLVRMWASFANTLFWRQDLTKILLVTKL